MNRDLAEATTGKATHDISHSLAGNLWWLLPPAVALFYPQALRALYESGKLLHRATGPAEALAWFAIVVSVALIYSVPAVGMGVAYLLGGMKGPLHRNYWPVELRTWRWPLLHSSC